MIELIQIQYRRDLWKVLPEGGDIAEIGVAEGYHSSDMLAWPGERTVYLVDRWRTVPDQKGDAAMPQEWHENNLRQAIVRTSAFGDRAVILRGNSVDMAANVPDGSLALVYIDGDHSFEGCLADIDAWFPKVMPMGILGFHDFFNEGYGVRPAVESFAAAYDLRVNEIPEDHPEDGGAWVRWVPE